MREEWEQPNNATNGSTDFASAAAHEYIIALKFFVSLSCILSIFGSMLIIIAYIAFKETRTTARQLLFNLSIADFITALANLVGLLTNFERLHHSLQVNEPDDTKVSPRNGWVNVSCTVQAFFAQLGTDSSIVWTIVIAVYMMLTIVLRKPSIAAKLLPLYYIVSWIVPAGIMIWFASVGFLGFEPNTTPGWCSIKSDPSYAVIVGYTLFVYIAFVVLPVLCIAIMCYSKIMVVKRGAYDPLLQSLTKSIDRKLILIAVIFMLLRIWGLVVDVFTFQVQNPSLKHEFETSVIGKLLIVLKGIGDSSQGFANSILFIGLTPSIRNKFFRIMVKYCCTKCLLVERYIAARQMGPSTVTDTETTKLLHTEVSDYSSDIDSMSASILTYEIHHPH